jgi:hypothetical protein
MAIKLITAFLLLALTAGQCVRLFCKKDSEIEEIKNNSKMENFYSRACPTKDDYVRGFTRNLLENAAHGKPGGARCMSYWRRNRERSAELVKALENAGNVSAIKVVQVWRSDLGGKKKVWIAECETAEPGKRIYLHFIECGQGLVLDEVD